MHWCIVICVMMCAFVYCSVYDDMYTGVLLCVQRLHPEAERNYYDSQIIILDTLKQVLNSVSLTFVPLSWPT